MFHFFLSVCLCESLSFFVSIRSEALLQRNTKTSQSCFTFSVSFFGSLFFFLCVFQLSWRIACSALYSFFSDKKVCYTKTKTILYPLFLSFFMILWFFAFLGFLALFFVWLLRNCGKRKEGEGQVCCFFGSKWMEGLVFLGHKQWKLRAWLFIQILVRSFSFTTFLLGKQKCHLGHWETSLWWCRNVKAMHFYLVDDWFC